MRWATPTRHVGNGIMVDNTEKLPRGWGTDDLTTFLDLVRQHQLAAFHQKRTACTLASEVDACFMKVGLNKVNRRTR
jgi:hypothetical protein